MPKQKLPFATVELFDSSTFLVTCPGCGGTLLIKKDQIKCGQFLHAVFQNKQLNPHRKVRVNSKDILGCGTKFRIAKINKEN